MSSLLSVPLMLANGVTMWPSADGRVIVVDADEQFAALDVEPEALPMLLGDQMPGPADVADRWPRLCEALNAMMEAGYIVARPQRAVVACTVGGEPVVAELLGAILGTTIEIPAGMQPADETIAIRVCPDLDALKDAGRRHELPVLLEGEAIALGPWSPIAANGPSVDDLIHRRLAAHPAPDLLEEFWRVAAQIPAHRAAHPARATVAAAAAWLLREFAIGGATLTGHQVLIPADLAVSIHPVLRRPRAEEPHPARPAIEGYPA